MKEYSAPEVVFDKFTTEEIAIGLQNSTEKDEVEGGSLDFGDLLGGGV